MKTAQEKFGILFTETKKLYFSKHNIEIKDFETIIKKVSPSTTVKFFSEIPEGSNVSPRTGAYFSQKTNINSITNEMVIADKIMYLNFHNTDAQPRLKLFGDFIHESTHIIQEESCDRLSTIDFTKRMLYSPRSREEKKHSLIGGVQGFTSIEYNTILPLIEALQKSDDIPRIIPYADKYILNRVYQKITGYSIPDYIKAVAKSIIPQLKMKLPFADENYILQYVHKKAGHEKEAYKNSLDFMKDIMNIKNDTDLDFRILLYDEFEKAIAQMIG